MRKTYLLILLFITFGAFLAGLFNFPAFADVNCVTQYGGGQTCTTTQLIVNKQVWDPDGKAYVDNLTLSNHHFQNGEEVDFTISVQNTGDITLTNVNFADTLPANLTWIGGDALSSTIGSLAPGQTATKNIKTKVANATALICELNSATATSDQGSDSDTAQVCLGQGQVKAATYPATGPETAVWAVLPGLGTLGYFLKRKGVK
ncbi:MAG: DUF11 domain-containing protein [Patescibacteria group bacterium]|nr:DUF11 domain-containing protein [Patescibacteria group bacterium]